MGLTLALIRALAIMLAIPAIGFGVSIWIISNINADMAKEELPSIQDFCFLTSFLTDADADADISVADIADMRAACDEFSEIELLGDASILAAVIAVGVLAIYSRFDTPFQYLHQRGCRIHLRTRCRR